MPIRLYRAWRFYIRLNYSWHLAWHKAAYQRPLQYAPRRLRPSVIVAYPGQVL